MRVFRNQKICKTFNFQKSVLCTVQKCEGLDWFTSYMLRVVKEQEVEKGCISSLGWKMMEASKWPNCFRNTFIFRLYSFDKEVPDISEIFDIFWEDRVWAPRQLLLLLWYHRYSLATLAQKELSLGSRARTKKNRCRR